MSSRTDKPASGWDLDPPPGFKDRREQDGDDAEDRHGRRDRDRGCHGDDGEDRHRDRRSPDRCEDYDYGRDPSPRRPGSHEGSPDRDRGSWSDHSCSEEEDGDGGRCRKRRHKQGRGRGCDHGCGHGDYEGPC